MVGLPTLRKVRGLDEVYFHGCPTLEAVFKADMLKPKAIKKTTVATGKKRAGGISNTAEGSKAKKQRGLKAAKRA